MAQTPVPVSGVEVASTPLQSPQMTIHLHRESALTQLTRALGGIRQVLPRPRESGPSKKTRGSPGQLALGVTQIFMGVASCALGVCLSFGPWTELRARGCAFWTGSVAIVAGIGTIVHEKYQGKLWGHMSRLLTLAGIATAVAAVVLGVRSLIWQSADDFSVDWRLYMCRESMKIMMNMFLAFCILLTVLWILKIIVFMISLGLSFRSSCGHSSRPADEEGSEKKLLENSVPPSPVKEKIPVIL